ncbi:MAG: hypothetical protein WD740_01445 [Anaerolineales bacterium]
MMTTGERRKPRRQPVRLSIGVGGPAGGWLLLAGALADGRVRCGLPGFVGALLGSGDMAD